MVLSAIGCGPVTEACPFSSAYRLELSDSGL